MQLLPSDETEPEPREFPEKSEEQKSPSDSLESGIDEEGVALDVSGKSLEFPASENAEESVESLYLYKNVYSLIPKSVGGLVRLKTLKFFGNEINLFAPEFGNLTGLECLQLKISSPGIGGLPLHKLNDLKELELSKAPPRPSAFPILTQIAGLKRLTKLSICHFSLRLVFLLCYLISIAIPCFHSVVILGFVWFMNVLFLAKFYLRNLIPSSIRIS